MMWIMRLTIKNRRDNNGDNEMFTINNVEWQINASIIWLCREERIGPAILWRLDRRKCAFPWNECDKPWGYVVWRKKHPISKIPRIRCLEMSKTSMNLCVCLGFNSCQNVAATSGFTHHEKPGARAIRIWEWTIGASMGEPLYRWMVYFMENPNLKNGWWSRGTPMTMDTTKYII